MAEANLQQNNGVGTSQTSSDQPTGSQPVQNSDKGVVAFDPSKLGEKDWEVLSKSESFWNTAFQHERFKSLNEKAKRADEIEQKQQADEETKLKEQKKFEELATRKETELASWKEKYNRTLVDNRIIVEANKLGVVDQDAVISLINRAGIKIEEGNALGVEEAVKELVTAKPYLLSKPQPIPNIGSGSNPGSDVNNTPKFKLSQLQDAKFYQDHRAEIMQAMRLNLIENDMQQ